MLSANRTTLLFERSDKDEHLRVALNLGQAHDVVELAGSAGLSILLSTFLDRSGLEEGSQVPLRPGEGVLLRSI